MKKSKLLAAYPVVLGAIMMTGMTLINGCAPRYLDKSPLGVIGYSYVPVDQKELANFKALVAINPKDPQAPKAYYWIGQDAFNREEWQKAYQNFSVILKGFPNSEWAVTAGIMLARIQVNQGKNLVAIAGLKKLLDQFSSPLIQKAVHDLAKKIINDHLSIEELARVRASYPGTMWAEYALFVLGKRQLDQGKPDMAVNLFEEFLQAYPSSTLVALVRELIDKASRIIPINRNRIGCLLPVTGMYAAYGQTIQQGLELAIQQLNKQRGDDEQFGLVVADTQGTTGGAVAGLERLRDIEKVMVIVGPALSNEVKAIAPLLQQQPIPVITTSAAQQDLTKLHPYLFRYMLTNEQQAEAMAEYMVLQKNLHRIGILSGQATYDQSLSQALADKVVALGGEVIAKLEYPPRATDFKEQMLVLGGVDPGKIKDQELKERKLLEKLAATAARQFKKIIAPTARIESEAKSQGDEATRKQVDDKRLAIIRFREDGKMVTESELGKLVTEKFSYALAPLDGIKVLTQADTFKGLNHLNLSPYEIEPYHAKQLGEALGVDFIVLGKVMESEMNYETNPGEPIPVTINIEMSLVSCQSNRVVDTTKKNWIKSLNPEVNTKDMEALYLPVPTGDAILIASQLEFYEIKVPVFGSDAWLTPKLLRQGREVLEQAVFSIGFWPDDPGARSKEFVQQFETKFSTRPSLLAAQSYDAMWLIAAILKQLPPKDMDRAKFQKQLLGMKAFRGITGRATIDPEGNIRRQPLFLQINQGKLRRVD